MKVSLLFLKRFILGMGGIILMGACSSSPNPYSHLTNVPECAKQPTFQAMRNCEDQVMARFDQRVNSSVYETRVSDIHRIHTQETLTNPDPVYQEHANRIDNTMIEVRNTLDKKNSVRCGEYGVKDGMIICINK